MGSCTFTTPTRKSIDLQPFSMFITYYAHCTDELRSPIYVCCSWGTDWMMLLVVGHLLSGYLFVKDVANVITLYYHYVRERNNY
jgi:hypothetical protein